MNRVAEFEKVSYVQFKKSIIDTIHSMNAEIEVQEEIFDENIQKLYSELIIPVRATNKSAGYDIHSPIDFDLPPHCSITIPTGLRIKIDDGWFLGILPRSSLGFKYRCQLDNTMGVIDGDYYDSDNEGHIFIKITNDNYQNKNLRVNYNDKIVQGILLPYGLTYSDTITKTRNGGIGSTGA